MVPNSLALIGSKLATLGSGFVFWLLVARLFEPAEVGLGAAVVSAMLLCCQLALLGAGSAVIKLFGAHAERPGVLTNAALTIVVVASAVVGGLFVAVSGSGLLAQLDVVAEQPGYALLFVAATLTGTAGAVLDQTSTALRRGDQALVRGVVFGVASIATLCVLVASGADGWAPIFAPWLAAGALVLTVGVAQFRRALPGYRLRPSSDWPLLRGVARVGIRNHLLTLAERAPQLLLPILVVELLSPGDNAAWYVAWMTAWVVFIVPVQVGMTAFAEAARDPGRLDAVVRRGLRTSLAIGVPGAALAALLAGPLLPLLGETYADEGTAPLRVLLLAVVPLCFTYTYYAACRAIGRIAQATALAWTTAAVGVAAATIAGASSGLTAMAAGWAATQFIAALWSSWRLRALVRGLGVTTS